MKRSPTRRCDCGTEMVINIPKVLTCPSCDLYNAAVRAQQAAAKEIASAYHVRAKDAWLNQYGVFADIDGIKRQIGTPEQAAPFAALTAAARKVKAFWKETPETGDPK